MALEDALPDRPLFDNEVETLAEDLPAEYRLIPGSAMDFGPGAAPMFPTFAVSDADGAVTLFGRSAEEERWMKIETWTADEYDPDEQAAAVHEWAEDHLPEATVESTFDM